MTTRKRKPAKPAPKSRAKKAVPLVAVPASALISEECASLSPATASPTDAHRHTPGAPEILIASADAIDTLSAIRDKPSGERTMPRAVAAFNALTGQPLTEVQGWLFMALVKAARATTGAYDAENYTDLAGYSGLAGEAAARVAATIRA